MKKLLLLAVFCVLVLPSLSLAEEIVVGGTEGIDLTVYNQNFALVRDQRTVPVSEGVNYVRLGDIAAYVDPATVRFISLTDPESLVIREQNYQYDLINATNILNKCVGKWITVRQILENGGMREISGKLLNPVTVVLPSEIERYSTPQPWARRYGGYYSGPYASAAPTVTVAGLVLQTDDGLIFNASGEIEVAELPEGLISKPSLLWKLEAPKAATHRAQLSYLTQGITWRADYVAQVNANEDALDMTGWVTMDNRSGATYRDAGLQLMAGEVRRVTPEAAARGYGGYGGAELAQPSRPTFEEQPFFEYHLYTMTQKTTIADNETKQLTLLSADGVPVKKVFVYDGGLADWQYWLRDPYSYSRSGRPGQEQMTQKAAKIAVMLEIKNSKENNLGMPLPKGIVRVYKEDPAGRLQFIGEDEIDHTPKDEEFRLWIGNAFDLVGERRRTDHKGISDSPYIVEDAYEIKLRNHKETPVEVEVVERIPADWEMLSNSHEYIEKDSNTIMFPVKVEPDKETVVTYRVRITYW